MHVAGCPCSQMVRYKTRMKCTLVESCAAVVDGAFSPFQSIVSVVSWVAKTDISARTLQQMLTLAKRWWARISNACPLKRVSMRSRCLPLSLICLRRSPLSSTHIALPSFLHSYLRALFRLRAPFRYLGLQNRNRGGFGM